MTREVGIAQQRAVESQRQAEAEHAYLDTVLTHLSAGVLSFDNDRHLQTFNAAAAAILETDLSAFTQQSIDTLAQALTGSSALIQAIKEGMDQNRSGWQKEIRIHNDTGRHTLICSGTRIDEGEDTVHVIVFEDATELLKAQRDAAWGEVARRLAHEIKNPLTPIQLSAERIRRKYLESLAGEDKETLDRSTRTIVQQVEAMKTMVNAFSEYARPAPLHRLATDINQLITDTVDLFNANETQAKVVTELAPITRKIWVDPNTIRQVLNNLIINARDASADQGGVVKIHAELDSTRDQLRVTVSDNGPGFSADNIERVFEPYVTSKEKGTGLGLAICRRIIEEHNGAIRATNSPAGGATVIISLPAPPE